MPNTTSTTATTEATPEPGSNDKARNLQIASHLVLAQLGYDKMGMTYDQRLVYNRALATVINKYPARFTEAAVSNALLSLQKNFTPLENTGFNLSAFGSAFADEAIKVGEKLAKVGNGAVDSLANTFTALKWALPIAVVGFVLILAYRKGNSL